VRILTKVVQAVAVLCAVTFLGLLFLNEPEAVETPEQADGGQLDDEPDDGQDDEPDDGGNGVDGAAVYADRCASCHGGDGGGGLGPQLSEGRVVENFPDVADQIALVTDGQGGMPAFGSRLTPEEIEAVVDFTRGL